jgi:hypothetical protein
MTSLLSSPTTIYIAPPPAAGTSALAALAQSMARGTWAQMAPVPTGLSNFVGTTSSYVRPGYSTKMASDPVGKKIYFIGCDHNENQTFHQYDEATNAWTLLATTPFAAPTKHGYEHNVWDSTNQKLYHRPFEQGRIYRWEGGSSWTAIPWTTGVSGNNPAIGMTWFPEAGRMILFQGPAWGAALQHYTPATGAWGLYGTSYPGSGDYHTFCQYSPARKIVYFGGGNGSTRVWTLNSAGVVSSPSDGPVALGTIGPTEQSSLPVVNPVNGNLIVMRNSTTWYEFNPDGPTWTAMPGTCSVLNAPYHSSGPTFGVIAAPLNQYGVIAFIKTWGTGGTQMWLFKP